MENTLENKAAFFAQYWGCNVLYVGGVGLQRVGFGRWNLRHPDFFIELTPLSQITDEDIDVIDMPYISIKDHLFNDIISQFEADYLRSKGYALPWLGISVEEQIKRGWVKLKTDSNE